MAPKTRGNHLRPRHIRAMNNRIYAPSELDSDVSELVLLAGVSLASALLSFLDVFGYGVPLRCLLLAPVLTVVTCVTFVAFLALIGKFCPLLRLFCEVVEIVVKAPFLVTFALALAGLLHTSFSHVWGGTARFLVQFVVALHHFKTQITAAYDYFWPQEQVRPSAASTTYSELP